MATQRLALVSSFGGAVRGTLRRADAVANDHTDHTSAIQVTDLQDYTFSPIQYRSSARISGADRGDNSGTDVGSFTRALGFALAESDNRPIADPIPPSHRLSDAHTFTWAVARAVLGAILGAVD